MKKVLIVGVCLLLMCGCNNSTNNNEPEKKEPVLNVEDTDEELKDSKTTVKPESNLGVLIDKLYEYGEELYNKKEYEKFNTIDELPYINLSDLKNKYNYDISMFKNSDGTTCDLEKTIIKFDVNRKINNDYQHDIPLLVTVVGCE